MPSESVTQKALDRAGTHGKQDARQPAAWSRLPSTIAEKALSKLVIALCATCRFVDLFLDNGKDQHVGVYRHTQRQYDTGDTRQRRVGTKLPNNQRQQTEPG